jgi:hypothetical protein
MAGYSPFMMAPMVPGYGSLGASRGAPLSAAEAAADASAGMHSHRPGSPTMAPPHSPLDHPAMMLSASPFGGQLGAAMGAMGGMGSPSPDTNFFGGAASMGSNSYAAHQSPSPAGAFGMAGLNGGGDAAVAALAAQYRDIPQLYQAAAAAALAGAGGSAHHGGGGLGLGGGGNGGMAGNLPSSLSGALSQHAAVMAAAAAAAQQHHQQNQQSHHHPGLGSGAFGSGALGLPPFLQGFDSSALEAAAYRDAAAAGAFARHLELDHSRAALEQQLSAAGASGLLGHGSLSGSLGAAVAQAQAVQAQQAASLLQVQQHLQAQQQAAAAAAALGAGAGHGGLGGAQMGRLRAVHSADLSNLGAHLDPLQLMQQAQQQRPR